MGRQSRVGGPPPQGPVPVLAGLMDGNGCSIGTHILSYKPIAGDGNGLVIVALLILRGEVTLTVGLFSKPFFER